MLHYVGEHFAKIFNEVANLHVFNLFCIFQSFIFSLCACALPGKWTVNLPYAIFNKMTNSELLCAILSAVQSWNFYYELIILLFWF